MIARESFEKSLPRFASAAPFLCLIDDHLLCPDTRLLSDRVQEDLVDASIVGQLRVERGDEDPALPREHRAPVDLRQHLDLRADLLEPGSADEEGPQRLVAVAEVEVRLEARHLPAEGIAADAEVAEAEVVPIEDDHPGTGAEDRTLEPSQGLVEAVEPHQAHERRRLTAGDDESVEPVDLFGLAHLHDLGAEPAEHRRVLAEVPLDCQDADSRPVAHSSDCKDGFASSSPQSNEDATVRIVPNRAVSKSRRTGPGESSVRTITSREPAAVAR